MQRGGRDGFNNLNSKDATAMMLTNGSSHNIVGATVRRTGRGILSTQSMLPSRTVRADEHPER